jgi:hypothetical protein
MAGIIGALATVNDVFNAVSNSGGGSKADVAKSVLDAVNGNNKKTTLIQTNGSITKLLSSNIIEPVIIASNNTKDVDVVDKILELNTDIFASFFMQAFNVLTVQHGLSQDQAIDILGTDNGGLNRLLSYGSSQLSKEDFKDEVASLLGDDMFLSIEAKRETRPVSTVASSLRGEESQNKVKDQPTHVLLQRNLEVSITSEIEIVNPNKSEKNPEKTKHTVVIPIIIKAHVLFVGTDTILNMLAPNAADKGFFNRLDEYRSGAISVWDLVFANDLISKYKDNKINGKDDLTTMINDRSLSAHSKLLSNYGKGGEMKGIGFENFYNMLVITDEDKIRIDKHLSGNMFKEKYKQELLEQAHALTATIIDQDHERVSILTKDIRGISDIGFKALSKRSDRNADLGDVVKALMNNRAPVF